MISWHQKLSEDYIREFNYELDLKALADNKEQKYYSMLFIKDFKPSFNEHYKFHYAANKIRNVWLEKYYKPGNAGHKNAIKEFETEFTEIVS